MKTCRFFLCVLMLSVVVGCQNNNKTTSADPAPEDMRASEPFPEEQVPPLEPQPARVTVATPDRAKPDPTPVDTSASWSIGSPAAAPTPQPKESYAPAVKKAPRYHTVRKGETLQKISKQYYKTTKNWRRIYEANRTTLKDPNMINVGMKLQIP